MNHFKLAETIAALITIPTGIFIFSAMSSPCWVKMAIASIFTFLVLAAVKLIDWSNERVFFVEVHPDTDLVKVRTEIIEHLRGKTQL
jgi:hypothetical protein